jgi:hypothetical protein
MVRAIIQSERRRIYGGVARSTRASDIDHLGKLFLFTHKKKKAVTFACEGWNLLVEAILRHYHYHIESIADNLGPEEG